MVVVLVIGVVAGVILGGRNGESAPAAAPEPANYSIAAIENACDLVDPTPLTRWASTPRPGPVHEQTRASGDFGNLQCSLSCQFTYKSRSGDGVHWNQAAIDLQVEFTAPGSAPAYDQWKREDTTGPGVNSGEVTGIGSRGYWCTATAGTGHTTALDYIVGVQDDNVSLRVRIPTLSQHGEPVPNADDLGMIARNQARLALDGLQK
ncbi:hypothetical protein [Nocardia flavorosea]|uniref:hypothetical protein n=1 Tax=Nocardia flavorosea TaxID=53429 RepID=UPI0024558582|nr:hypothetical protein [Nocardia flavorosea]